MVVIPEVEVEVEVAWVEREDMAREAAVAGVVVEVVWAEREGMAREAAVAGVDVEVVERAV